VSAIPAYTADTELQRYGCGALMASYDPTRKQALVDGGDVSVVVAATTRMVAEHEGGDHEESDGV
jgi:phage baseplate assembly protein gpV